LLPTHNRYAVVNAMQTNGENAEVRTWDIIHWLKHLHRLQPFDLTGIGTEFVEGTFTGPIANPFAIALSLMQISPDALDTPTLDDIEHPEFGDLALAIVEKRLFYVWWD
jgi:hypothetical protein